MKQVIIMRGLPGSGKSTFARKFVETINDGANCRFYSSSIRSTDQQFMVDGVYTFNPKLLGINHGRNFDLFCDDIENGIDIIIVDNTNIKRRDFAAYVTFAEANGYSVREEIVGKFDVDFVNICAKRNTHGVPLFAIERMAQNFEA